MLKYGLLGLLSYKELSGYDLNKAFKESIGFFWTATMSQVYRELNNMLKDEWLSCRFELQEGKPNKKIYAIKPAGKEKLLEWLFTYNGESYFISRNSFLVNLFFSGHKDYKSNIAMLRKFKADCCNYANSLQGTGEAIINFSKDIKDTTSAVYWEIVADLGKSQIITTLNWLDRSIEKLEKINENISN